MPIKLFNLAGVSEDEAADIRELLQENNIVYYQTPHSQHGIDQAAIWLRTDKHLDKAKKLINEYQKQRAIAARYEYESTPQKSFTQRFKEDKFSYIFFILIFFGPVNISV